MLVNCPGLKLLLLTQMDLIVTDIAKGKRARDIIGTHTRPNAKAFNDIGINLRRAGGISSLRPDVGQIFVYRRHLDFKFKNIS